MLPKVTAIIIDDEKPAREEMLLALAAFDSIEVVALCINATTAIDRIEELKPDVIFLDIELPGINGFELLRKLNHLPEVVFCTAYNQHATDAFEVNAIDYLLKPIQHERLKLCVQRIAAQLRDRRTRELSSKRFLLQSGLQMFLTNLAEIYLLEAEGNYVRFYFKENKVLKLCSIKAVQEELPDLHFLKINRSQIVNLNHIVQMRDLGRNIEITLRNRKVLIASRSATRSIRLQAVNPIFSV
jgi:two-component system LytT family response regulator